MAVSNHLHLFLVNNIGDDGAAALAKALKKNTSVTNIVLACKHIEMDLAINSFILDNTYKYVELFLQRNRLIKQSWRVLVDLALIFCNVLPPYVLLELSKYVTKLPTQYDKKTVRMMERVGKKGRKKSE